MELGTWSESNLHCSAQLPNLLLTLILKFLLQRKNLSKQMTTVEGA